MARAPWGTGSATTSEGDDVMTSPDETTPDPATTERESTPNASGPQGAAGGMGSSSERIGRTGPGQVGADGVRDTSEQDAPADAPPEQSPQPDGVTPKAGYPRLDPRHEDKPYKA
jgi:hypothetical protein